MRVVLILLTLIFFNSCGEVSEPIHVQGCNNDLASMKQTWTSDTSGVTYDISQCTAGVLCEFSDGTCDTVQEIQLLYNASGGVAYTTCGNNVTYSGNWRICGNVLEFFNMTNGANERFR